MFTDTVLKTKIKSIVSRAFRGSQSSYNLSEEQFEEQEIRNDFAKVITTRLNAIFQAIKVYSVAIDVFNYLD